jgi:hypothetical protein
MHGQNEKIFFNAWPKEVSKLQGEEKVAEMHGQNEVRLQNVKQFLQRFLKNLVGTTQWESRFSLERECAMYRSNVH